MPKTTETLPTEVEEPTSAEVTTEAEAPATSETTAEVESNMLDSDAFVNRVADAVFDRMKVYTETLTSAQQAAVEIASNMLPPDTAPAPAPAGAPNPEVAPQQDFRPERRHKVFGQPFKRGQ